MTSELKTIVDGLNGEPFKMNMNVISFDTISNIRLLQILSDVLLWIETSNSVDIREERTDQTALRIFNSLRILSYRPPMDNDELQQWRRGVVEGEKSAIYPILEWIFTNVDALKERAYLAKYLTKIDVPGAFQDSEVAELSNQISNLMEEFKAIHSQVVDARKDSLLVEDIRVDLKAMGLEKEQLSRRIEKIERKLRGVTNIEHFLRVAEKCRLENERLEQFGRLKLEQRNAVIFNDQKLQRLKVVLKEMKAAGENTNLTKEMEALKEEIETNYYMVSEKLPKEIETKATIIADLSKITDVAAAVDKDDIAELQHKIEKTNQEIMDMINERDRKDESTNKLSIYRHQASAISKKKATLVEQLQKARSELQSVENVVEAKKNELREKAGTDFVISTVQFKNYVNMLRTKTSNYKRKRAEVDDLKNDLSILMRTVDILTNQWSELKQKIEESGNKIIETCETNNREKPKTIKPETDDIKELRKMIKELNQELDFKKTTISALTESNNELNEQFAEASERFILKKRNYAAAGASLESAFAQLERDVKEMEERITISRQKIFRNEIELQIMKTVLQKLTEEGTEGPKLINQIEEEINRINKEAETLHRVNKNNADGLSIKEATAQLTMWRSLMKIFELKLHLLQQGHRNGTQNNSLASDAPVDDQQPNYAKSRLYPKRPTTASNTRHLQKDNNESSDTSTAD